MIIKDKVEINGVGVARNVWVINPENSEVLKTIRSGNDGYFTVDVSDSLQCVLLCTADCYNNLFKTVTPYTESIFIRPTTFKGLMFKCVIEGISGDIEPQWPDRIGDVVTSGTVVFQAVPYYRPVAKMVFL